MVTNKIIWIFFKDPSIYIWLSARPAGWRVFCYRVCSVFRKSVLLAHTGSHLIGCEQNILSVCSSREVGSPYWKLSKIFGSVVGSTHKRLKKKTDWPRTKIIIFLTVSAARCAEKLIIYLFLSVMLGSRNKNHNFLISGTKNKK